MGETEVRTPSPDEERVLDMFGVPVSTWRRDAEVRGHVATLAHGWDQQAVEALEGYGAAQAAAQRGGPPPDPVGGGPNDPIGDGGWETMLEDVHARPQHVDRLKTRRTAKGRRLDAAAGLAETLERGASALGYSLAELARPFARGRLTSAETERRGDLARLVARARSEGATLAAIAAALELTRAR